MSEENPNSLTRESSVSNRVIRALSIGIPMAVVALGMVPIASAHGSDAHAPNIPQWQAFVVALVGILIVGTSILARRRQRLATRSAIRMSFIGLVVTVIGSIGLVQLTPVDGLPGQPPGIRELYPVIALFVGANTIFGSILLGRLYWPNRPRYSAAGVALGSWILYPTLFDGATQISHPFGYTIVLGTFLVLGYLLWTDGRPAIRLALSTKTSRRFGLGITVLTTIFFLFSAGMFTLVPDEGVGLQWTHDIVTTASITGPLVLWPAVEFWFPHIPIGGFLSIGMGLVVLTLSTLVGLNAAFAAQQWLTTAEAGSSSTVSGAAALAGPNACCCCGPVLSQLVVVALGPSAAAPLYWVFVDIASPVGSIFLVSSLGFLTASLVRAGNSIEAPRTDDGLSSLEILPN